jgi:hypothetical protein
MAIVNGSDVENINVYQDTGETTRCAHVVWRDNQSTMGPHVGQECSQLALEARVPGGGVNGPTSADYGFTFSVRKKNIGGTGANCPITGEIDGLNVVVANDGAATSDAGGILINVANLSDGFTTCVEGVSSAYDITKSYIMRQVRFQLGDVDRKNSHSFGLNVSQCIGADGDAYRCDTLSGQWWTNFLNFYNNGVQKYSVDGNGVARGGAVCVAGPPQAGFSGGVSWGGTWGYATPQAGSLVLSKPELYLDIRVDGSAFVIPAWRK